MKENRLRGALALQSARTLPVEDDPVEVARRVDGAEPVDLHFKADSHLTLPLLPS